MEKFLLSTIILLLVIGSYNLYEQESYKDSQNHSKQYEEFTQWCKKFKKTYSSAHEQLHRFLIYQKNILMIERHNKMSENVTFEINQFMDLEYQEFKALMMSGHQSESHESLEEDQERIIYLDIKNLPDEVDWRGKAIPEIKDQGKCGSCWAFSTVGALEGAYAVKNGKVISLSEQQVVDCCRLNLYGCNGGDPIVAFDQCILIDGIMKNEDYPYTGVFSKNCKWDSNRTLYKPSDYAVVPHNDTTQLQMAISLQPVSVCISSSSSFHFYKSGILNDIECGKYIDHCIVAVGYGTENGIDYWLLRNSWGTNWGEDGYVRVKRDRGISPGICGVAMEASYAIL